LRASECLPTPRVIDGTYKLVRQLGGGAMGAVYEALHLGTMRRVAVKVIASEKLAADKEIVGRFRTEAMATGAIESQHIAQVLDTGTDRETGSPYIVMEFLVGEDMEATLERLGPLPPPLALRVTAQACLGLQKAHDTGVIHRDIKPANIFLAHRDGGECVVKIVDFGIAKMRLDPLGAGQGKSATRSGTMLGSPLYMSPEQAFGRKTLDHRTDIWSLGVVLYELLTGKAPHAAAETVGELVVAVCQQPPRLVQEDAPWVSSELAWVVHKALALAPSERFQTADEMLSAVRALLPVGHAIDESMLVPLTAAELALVARRMPIVPAMRAPSPSLAGVPDAAVSPTSRARSPARTTVGFETSGGQRDVRPAAILAGFLVLAVTGLVVAASGRLHTPTPATHAIAAEPELVHSAAASAWAVVPVPDPQTSPDPVVIPSSSPASPSAPRPAPTPPPRQQAKVPSSHPAAPRPAAEFDPSSVR